MKFRKSVLQWSDIADSNVNNSTWTENFWFAIPVKFYELFVVCGF